MVAGVLIAAGGQELPCSHAADSACARTPESWATQVVIFAKHVDMWRHRKWFKATQGRFARTQQPSARLLHDALL